MNGFEDIVRDVATRVATRVVICPRWVITSLRPSRPVRDRGVWRRALRESGALADPIVNRGRQKSRARARVREHGACLDLWQFRRGAKKEEAGVKTHRREEWHGRQIYIYTRRGSASTMAHPRSFHFGEMGLETPKHRLPRTRPTAAFELEFLLFLPPPPGSRRLIGLMGVAGYRCVRG